jgi:glycosyltransferase involved in cell wall biosynthesis
MKKSHGGQKASILWLTNLPAPYRIPIWEHINQKFDLTVALLSAEINWRNWTFSENITFSHNFLHKLSLRISEYDFMISPFGAKKIIEDSDLVIIGGWESPMFLSTAWRARRQGLPVIQFYESTHASHRFNGRLVRMLRSKIFSLADFVLTSGRDSTNAVLDMGIAPEKIVMLFNPVDVEWFANFAHTHRVVGGNGHRFLYVGQLIERKNVQVLIDAFAAIRNPEDSLTIAGDGVLLLSLQDHSRQLGLGYSVQFTGHHSQEEVAHDYANADTLILSSTHEVWGLVVNEALASGLHVVVSKDAGVAEFVEPMKGAYIADPTALDLARAMKESRENWKGAIPSPEIMAYTPEKFADGVVELVGELLDKWKSPRLTWVTNIPAPYRIPIWKSLDSKLDFNLLFFSSTERGRNWNLFDQIKKIKYQVINIRPVYLDREIPLYLNWLKTWRFIRRTKPQSIYFDGYESPTFFIPAWLAKKNQIQVIFGYRSTHASHRFNGRLVRMLRSKIFSLADFVLTSGRDSTNAVLDMGIAPEKIVMLFNPVDVEWFANFAHTHRVVGGNGHRFLYVGQLIERKNVQVLIDAFAAIRNPEDSLTIAGDGVLLLSLQDHSRQLGLGYSVQFTGHHSQEEVAHDYANADTLILSSTHEVWGLVVNEALASGLHVVVSKDAGVAEFVEPMKGAYIADPTALDLARAMKESRENWKGAIPSPEIMAYTPEKFADGVVELVGKNRN